MRATVFLGPTMSVEKARTILPDADYRPPAAQQDLISAANELDSDVIGLIDGTFHQTLSVWHSEVCYLLSRGVTVVGASSMGALRAVETERYGMVGVGTVYRWYRDGVISADDEVALVHGDLHSDFRPMSLPLVNIRASLNRAATCGSIAISYADRVIEVARSLYYPDRQIPTILQGCQDLGFSQELLVCIKRALTEEYVDVKLADATEMLTYVRQVVSGELPRPPRVEFVFSRSGVFDALYNMDRHVQVADTSVSLQSIREHAAVHSSDFEDVNRAGLDKSIVAYFAMLLGLSATPQELEAQRRTFLAHRCLLTQAALDDWLRANGVCDTDLSEYLEQEVLCERMRRWVVASRGMDRGCRAVLDEARFRGLFPEWASAAAEEKSTIAAYGTQSRYESLRQDDPRRLAAIHHFNTGVHISGDARIWAENAGFEDVRDLIEKLRRAAIYYDVKARIANQMKALDRAESILRGMPDTTVSL